MNTLVATSFCIAATLSAAPEETTLKAVHLKCENM